MNNFVVALLLTYMVIAVLGYAYVAGEKYIYMTEVLEYNERH